MIQNDTPATLRVDTHLPRTDIWQDTRPVTQVAVAILQRADASYLLTSRPPSKVYPNYWEFPGGKLEAGESVAMALQRELKEELGLRITTKAVQQCKQTRVDYPHALVDLHFCKVHTWQGILQMRENQQHSWQRLPVQLSPLLPATIPVLEWLQQAMHM